MVMAVPVDSTITDMTRADPEYHRFIFWANGMGWKTEIWHVVGLGHGKACDQASGVQHRHGRGQGRPQVPQVHLLGLGEALEG